MNKVMEYMALGKPTVAFDLTETKVSGGESAAYVVPNDELQFARQVCELFDDPGRRQRMGSGRPAISWPQVSRGSIPCRTCCAPIAKGLVSSPARGSPRPSLSEKPNAPCKNIYEIQDGHQHDHGAFHHCRGCQ